MLGCWLESSTPTWSPEAASRVAVAFASLWLGLRASSTVQPLSPTGQDAIVAEPVDEGVAAAVAAGRAAVVAVLALVCVATWSALLERLTSAIANASSARPTTTAITAAAILQSGGRWISVRAPRTPGTTPGPRAGTRRSARRRRSAGNAS